MSGTSFSARLRGRGDSGPGRSRRVAVWLGAVLALVIIAFVAAAVIPGSHSGGGTGSARHSVAGPSGPPTKASVTKAYDVPISAKNYGAEIAAMENGFNTKGQAVSDLSPVPVRFFDPVFRQYRAYGVRVADALDAEVHTLTITLATGNRGLARRQWDTAFADFLHLGATYGLLPTSITHKVDGLPPYIGSRNFPGLHRLEMGLWTGESLRSLVPIARQLSASVVSLRHIIKTTPLDPLDYGNRAHEVLEDDQRDYLSGTQVRWSHEGVLATAADLVATRELVRTLTPILRGRDNTLGTVQYWEAQLGKVLSSLRRPNGTYPTLNQLSAEQTERLNNAVAGALSQLQEIPSTLETKANIVIPSIPTKTTK